MTQFTTLKFPNTRSGQADKIRTLQQHTAQGWKVVSENIIPGKFRGDQACCLFLICMPCAFLAGHTDDTITVTLQRDDAPTNNYDEAKWKALLKYDSEIAAAATRLTSFGPKWADEFASAYLTLNDKTYLPAIETRIVERANAEEEEKRAALRQQDEARKALEAERERAVQDRRAQYSRLYYTLWGNPDRRIWTAIACTVFALIFFLVLLLTSGH